MRRRHAEVKGTWEYSAKRLVEQKSLAKGQSLTLRRETDNQYDRNAVGVFSGRSKVGYLPRNLAAEVAGYLDAGGRHSVTVAHLGTRTHKGERFPSVAVDVVLQDMPDQPGINELFQAAVEVGPMRGIYQIFNTIEKRGYVGSSSNVEKRLKSHLVELINGEHANRKISDDWRIHGAISFRFEFVEEVRFGDLLVREAHHINRLGTYFNGYNTSSDGVGKIPKPAAEVTRMIETQAIVARANWANIARSAAVESDGCLSSSPPASHVSQRKSKGSGCLLVILAAVVPAALLIHLMR
jgi:hypothetical protein